MLRYLPAIAWTLALYAGTTLTAGHALAPAVAPCATAEQVRAAWFWFDFQHVILHAAAYGVLAGLLALPTWGKTKNERLSLLAACLIVVLVVGLGQEALQTAIRWQVRLADSLSDLASNFGGAILSLGMVSANRWDAILRVVHLSAMPNDLDQQHTQLVIEAIDGTIVTNT